MVAATQDTENAKPEALAAVLVAAIPYLLDAARRAERLGLAEEAAAAWAVYRRARWSIRAVEDGGGAPVDPRPVVYED